MGGNSGVPKECETWDDVKYDKYNIDPYEYDHTDIFLRAPILMNLYSSNRLPYITVTHLWDHLSNGLLYSKYNPLKIGRSEPAQS